MEMSIIDSSIKELSKWRKSLNYDNGDYCYGDDTTMHSLDVAMGTMRKYQKITEIVGNYGFDTSWEVLKKIQEVIEDGNDTTNTESN